MRTWKILAALFVVLGSSIPAWADFETKIVIQNVVLWRGLSFSQGANESNHPGVGGGISYMHDSGFSLGTYTMNLQTPFHQEFMHWLAYTLKVGDWSITPAAYRYWFPRAMQYSRYDARVTANWKNLTLFVSYMPEYFFGPGFDGTHDDQSSDLYFMANYAQPIEDHVAVVGEVGYSMFSDEKYVGMKNYLHYSIALRHWTDDKWSVDMGWSETNRKEFVTFDGTSGPTKKSRDNYAFFKITKLF